MMCGPKTWGLTGSHKHQSLVLITECALSWRTLIKIPVSPSARQWHMAKRLKERERTSAVPNHWGWSREMKAQIKVNADRSSPGEMRHLWIPPVCKSDTVRCQCWSQTDPLIWSRRVINSPNSLKWGNRFIFLFHCHCQRRLYHAAANRVDAKLWQRKNRIKASHATLD